MVEGRCLQAMKIVHHYADGCFDWLISWQQSVYPSRKAIYILSGKYKSPAFVSILRDPLMTEDPIFLKIALIYSSHIAYQNSLEHKSFVNLNECSSICTQASLSQEMP